MLIIILIWPVIALFSYKIKANLKVYIYNLKELVFINKHSYVCITFHRFLKLKYIIFLCLFCWLLFGFN